MTSKEKSKALMTEDEALQEDMTGTPPASISQTGTWRM